MKCKIKIELKTGEKIGYIIRQIDTVIIDGAFVKIYESRDDDYPIMTTYTWNEIKKIKITEVKYI